MLLFFEVCIAGCSSPSPRRSRLAFFKISFQQITVPLKVVQSTSPETSVGDSLSGILIDKETSCLIFIFRSCCFQQEAVSLLKQLKTIARRVYSRHFNKANDPESKLGRERTLTK